MSQIDKLVQKGEARIAQLKHELRNEKLEMNALVTTGKLIQYASKPPSKGAQQVLAVPTPPTTPQALLMFLRII